MWAVKGGKRIRRKERFAHLNTDFEGLTCKYGYWVLVEDKQILWCVVYHCKRSRAYSDIAESGGDIE